MQKMFSFAGIMLMETVSLFYEKCWFLYNSENKSFECNSCNKTFKVLAKFLHHRKIKHSDSVQACKKQLSGTCKYGSEMCWFSHRDLANSAKSENSENEQNTNETIMEKIFQMMEKFTQQIVEMKERNNLK